MKVKVGGEEHPVENLFGTSFTLEYDASRLSVVSDESGAFLGEDVVYTSNNDSTTGEIGIGVTRKSSAGGVHGTGIVARVKFAVGQGTETTGLDFTLSEVDANDPSGNGILLSPQSATVKLSSTPPIAPEVTSPQKPGSEFWVDVKVGSGAYSVQNLFGTSFTLEYDASRLSVVSDESGAFLGEDVVYTSNNDSTTGEIGIGVTRKSGAGGVAGKGVVARVKFQVQESTPEGTGLDFALNEVDAEAPDGDAVALRPEDRQILTKTPVAAESTTVSGNGLVDFGNAGVAINFFGIEGSGEAVVRKYDGGPNNPINIAEKNKSSYRFVIETGPGLKVGSGTEVRFDASSLSGLSEPGKVTVYKRPKTGQGPFKKLQTSYDAEAGELVVKTDGFSEFAFGSNANPLPVELARFRGVARGRAAVLRWRTASETNNAGFAIQHQPPGGKNWEKLSFVESKAQGGTTTEPTSYRFRAEGLNPGTHRFRLRQVDLDGSTRLSDPVTLELQMKEALRLRGPFPNPVSEAATLTFAVKKRAEATIALYDLLGQQVKTLYEGTPAAGESRRLRVDVSGLSSGPYFLRLRAGGKTETGRLTVVQ